MPLLFTNYYYNCYYCFVNNSISQFSDKSINMVWKTMKNQQFTRWAHFLDNESKRVSFNRTHFFKLWSLLETCFCQLYRQGTVPLQQVYINYGKSTDLLSLLSDTRLYLPAPNSSVRFFWWLSSVLSILKVFQTFPTFAMITIWNVVCFIFFASTSSLCSNC